MCGKRLRNCLGSNLGHLETQRATQEIPGFRRRKNPTLNDQLRQRVLPRRGRIRGPGRTSEEKIVIVQISVHVAGNLGCLGPKRGPSAF